MASLNPFSWSDDQRPELQAALAHHAGFGPSPLETEKVPLFGGSLEATLRVCAPAIVELPGGQLLGVANVRLNWARVLAPDLVVRAIAIDDLRAALCQPAEAEHVEAVEAIVAACGITDGRRVRVRAALLRDRVRTTRVAWAWQLRVPPGSSFTRQQRDGGLMRCVLAFVLTLVAEALAWVIAWWMVTTSALLPNASGRLDEALMVRQGCRG